MKPNLRPLVVLWLLGLAPLALAEEKENPEAAAQPQTPPPSEPSPPPPVEIPQRRRMLSQPPNSRPAAEAKTELSANYQITLSLHEKQDANGEPGKKQLECSILTSSASVSLETPLKHTPAGALAFTGTLKEQDNGTVNLYFTLRLDLSVTPPDADSRLPLQTRMASYQNNSSIKATPGRVYDVLSTDSMIYRIKIEKLEGK